MPCKNKKKAQIMAWRRKKPKKGSKKRR